MKAVIDKTNVQMYSILLGIVRKVLKKSNFFEVRLPSIHPGKNKKREVFEVDFFGQKARLSPSNGLYSTVIASNLGRVYSIQRCYRPETTKTYKHLSEFDMLIVSFVSDGFEDLVDLLIYFIKEIFKEVSCILPVKVKSFETVPVVEYDEINQKYSLNNGYMDLYEREIAKKTPVIITHLPSKISLWNARSFNENHSFSLNLMVPNVGELAEGCLRETRKEILKHQFISAGVIKQLGWFIDLNSHPDTKICSFGLGLERLAMWLFMITDIRQINYFYRDTNFMENEQHEK